MTETDERVLIKQAQSGVIEARNKIVERYLDFVKKVNAKFGNSEDGYQEGILGLMKAIEKYQCMNNITFSSYAFYWIKKYILSFNEKNYYKANSYIATLHRELIRYEGTKVDFYKAKKLKARTIRQLEYFNSQADIESCEISDNTTAENIESNFNKDFLKKIMEECLDSDERYILSELYLSDHSRDLTKEFKNLELLKNRALKKIRGYIYENYHNGKRERLLNKSVGRKG